MDREHDLRAPVFAACLTAVLCVLWAFTADRDGSWRQTPYWDMAWFHCQALSMLERLRSLDPAAIWQGWTHESATHAPLVPAISAIFMVVLGPSRAAAELVLPLATFVFLLATFRIAERLFDRATAYGAAALAATFPVVLTYGRYYFFEGPFAACFAGACWAALASEGFTRWKPALAFGVLAGLTALARAAGFAYLTGLVAALAVFERARPELGRRAARFAVASALGVALAGTWYFPHFSETAGYLFRVTYGTDARTYAGGAGSWSLANFLYCAEWLVLDGPGVPSVAIALLAFAAAAVKARGRGLLSRPILWVWTVLGVDFLVCVAGAQRMWGKFLLPFMPFVAILVVRALVNIPWRRPRAAAGAAVALLGLHHWIACTFLFETDFVKPGVRFQASEPGQSLGELSNHHNFFLEWAKMSGGADARIDYRIPEAADRLDALGLAPWCRVAFLGEHAILSPAALQLECQRRQRPLFLLGTPGLRAGSEAEWEAACLAQLTGADAAIVRTVATDVVGSSLIVNLFAKANDGVRLDMRPAGEPLTMGDGSRLVFYKRAPSPPSKPAPR